MQRFDPLTVLVALIAIAAVCHAAPFLDDFSSDTSANYTYTDTFNSGGSFNVSAGTLNLTSAASNTANVFHSTAQLEAGELVRVTVPVGTSYDFYLTVSSTNRAPNIGSEDGIRWNVWNASTLRARTHRNGAVTNTTYSGIGGIWTGNLTLLIYRDTNTSYRVGYDVGSGPIVVDTITIAETAADDGLFVGVEGYYGSGARRFDNLEILSNSTTGPAITSFSVSNAILSSPGPVTFSWSAENVVSATLNGQDVTGQSPLMLTVSESGDYTLVVSGADGSTASRTIRISVGDFFRIAAVADPQYADAPPRDGREPGEGVNRLTHAISAWNQRDLDWGVILGDIIDWDDINYGSFPGSTTTVAPQDWSNTNAILAAWEQLGVPGHLVLGNHDFYVPNQDPDGLQKPHSVYRAFGFQGRGYYGFRHKGFKFIVLEGDNSHLNYAEGTPEYNAARAYFNSFVGPQTNGGAVWWNAGILTPQLIWLMEELDRSLALDEPVVVMCHYPIHTPLTNHSLYNADQVRAILDGYRNVVLWLNGHNHAGDYARMGTRHHLNLKGMQNEAANWYEIAISPDRILVYQAENTTTPAYDLDISRPSSTVPRPSGFAVAESGGAASLSWDPEPAGVTGVVIEARQVDSAGPWQVLANLSPPTGGSFVDSVSNPVAGFRYRIRFQAGTALSRYSQALGVGESAGLTYSEFAAGLGASAESPFGDADGDGKPNVLEQFHGTRVLAPDADPERELRIATSATGAVQLVFSHLSSSIHDWDVAMTTGLDRWQALSRDVDYRVVSRETWIPQGTAESLTRVTLELMAGTSRALEAADKRCFLRLQVSPAVD